MEKTLHLNALELKAIMFGITVLCQGVWTSHMRVGCDNTCSVAYINASGGIKSLKCNEIARTIWEWCLEQSNFVSAEHIPGILNADADYESRNQ